MATPEQRRLWRSRGLCSCGRVRDDPAKRSCAHCRGRALRSVRGRRDGGGRCACGAPITSGSKCGACEAKQAATDRTRYLRERIDYQLWQARTGGRLTYAEWRAAGLHRRAPDVWR